MGNLLNVELVSVAIDTDHLTKLTPGVYHEVDTLKAVLVKKGLGQEDSIVKIEPNGTVGNPHHTFETGMCVHSDTGIWIKGTKQVFSYDRKEWEEKGFPLPLYPCSILDPKKPLPLTTLVNNLPDATVTADVRTRLRFELANASLHYVPLGHHGTFEVTKIGETRNAFHTNFAGDYCFIGDKFFVQGLNTQHVYKAEDIYKILSELDPRIVIPREKCLTQPNEWWARGQSQQSPLGQNPYLQQTVGYPQQVQQQGMYDPWTKAAIETLQGQVSSMEKDIKVLNKALNVQRSLFGEMEWDIKRLLKLAIEDPYISINALASQLGLSRNRVTTLLSLVKEYEILSREGNARSGPLAVHEVEKVLSELKMR